MIANYFFIFFKKKCSFANFFNIFIVIRGISLT